MKKRFLYTLFSIALFSSCTKDNDTVFDRSPDERINEVLDEYQSQLVNAPYGWKAMIAPAGAGGGVFSFYFRFNDSNRVEMFSDFDSASAVTPRTSSYRLKALQQPSLLFDTYSYVHVLADPDASNNGGAYGRGLGSDFEFAIEGMSGDTMKLRGRFHNSTAWLVKATQQEANDFYDKKFGNRLFDNMGKYVHYFKRLITPGKQYEISVNKARHTIAFAWLDGNGNVRADTTGYYYTIDGIALYPAFSDGTQTIASLTGMSWDEAATVLSFQLNGATGSIVGLGQPIKVDTDAPRRWWQTAVNQDSYWVSVQGFHVNGVDDYYGITQMPDYYFMLFWPRFGTSGGINYDLCGYVKFDTQASLEYGHAYRQPAFTADGRAIFPILGTLGDIPSSDSVAVHRTREQFMEPQGYYFVQINANTYDMVSAKDGKAWITWEW